MKTTIYNISGKAVGDIDLPESVFGVEGKNDLVHQVMISMMSNKRQGTAHSKDRGEVSGGGKKPWKQKGTGRARHGSIRSPIWIGGGVTHGPRNERNFAKKINRKMKRAALRAVLSAKLKNGKLILVDSFEMKEPKTKLAKEAMANLATVKGFETLATRRNNAALIATNGVNENARRSFANFSNVKLDEVRKMNLLDLLRYQYVVIENPNESVKILAGE